MIGKVITLTRKPGGARRGFGPVVAYIARDTPDPEGRPQEPIGAAELGLINLDADYDTPDARVLIAQLMNATAARSKGLRTNPAYHVALSWREGEHPTIAQVDHAVQHVMTALGMAECQALWALHRDTDQDHVHVVMNRVHPEKGIVVGPPRFDYRVIDKACPPCVSIVVVWFLTKTYHQGVGQRESYGRLSSRKKRSDLSSAVGARGRLHRPTRSRYRDWREYAL